VTLAKRSSTPSLKKKKKNGGPIGASNTKSQSVAIARFNQMSKAQSKFGGHFTDGDRYKTLFSKVKAHMKWDEATTRLWFRTQNRHFGGSAPDYLIKCGRIHKLEEFVLSAIEENTPSVG
jgi:hypothetical protein